MNKKVALSVLSATVFASMAASAFAAPKSGLYIGGNVDKYYSMNTLLGGMSSSALDQFSTEIGSAGFSNLIYVDFDGKGASIADIMSATDFESAKKDLTADKFEGVYSNIKADGTSDGTYDPRNDAIDTPTGDLKVESVSAINGKTLQVKFSKAVDPATVITAGNPAAGVVVTALEGQTYTHASAVATLSKDNKTLTIEPPTTEGFKGKYSVVIKDSVETTDDEKVAPFNTVVDVQDNVRPSVTGVTYSTDGANPIAIVQFSEPVDITNDNYTFKRVDGVALDAGTDFENTAPAYVGTDKSKVAFTFDQVAAADKGKDIEVSITSVTDFANNLVTPNPAKATFKVDNTDVTAPTVSSVTVKDNDTLVVKFSEKLQADPGATSITITGTTPRTSTTVTVDDNDPTLYTVDFDGPFSTGLQTVTFPDLTDIYGNNVGAASSKIVNVAIDTAKPVVEATKLEKINGVEYLVVSYNENVVPVDGKDIDGVYVKDYVTSTPATLLTTDAVAAGGVNVSLYNPVDGKSKTIKVDLTSLTNAGDYTVSLEAGFVNDLNGNPSDKKENVTFTRTTNVVADKPELDITFDGNGIKLDSTDNNIVEVHFKKAVDPQTALNTSNYTIEGVTISKATLTQNNSTGAIVKLTLAKNSSTFDGARSVTVSGVKSQDGTAVMAAVSTTEDIKENVVPTVTKAELITTSKIKLTFSENVTSADGNDFEVFVGGELYTVDGTAATAGQHTEGSLSTAAKTLEIDLGTAEAIDATKLASGVVVKPASTINVVDGAGNALDLTSVNVTVAQ